MDLRTINAEKGGYFLPVTIAHTGLQGRALVINTAATFTTLTVTNGAASHDALEAKSDSNAYGQNLTGASISAGIVIYAPDGFYFSAVTMSTGTAYLINI
jgi:hypothetical protein